MSHPPESPLHVQRFLCSGQFQENCYLIWPAEAATDRPCWIIDPGADTGELVDAIVRAGLSPAAIALTHGHLDHVAGIPELRQRWPELPIWIGRAEREALQSPRMNASAMFGLDLRLAETPDRLLDDGETLPLGPLEVRTITVAGHSAGGVCYHCPASGDLFSGDVLFAGSIGRSDGHGGDGARLVREIRDKLLGLDGATRVWPGHGRPTTIARESAGNPYLADPD